MNKWYVFCAIISCFFQHRVIDRHVSMCTSPLVFSSSLVYSNFSGPVQRKGSLAQIQIGLFYVMEKKVMGSVKVPL